MESIAGNSYDSDDIRLIDDQRSISVFHNRAAVDVQNAYTFRIASVVSIDAGIVASNIGFLLGCCTVIP